MPMKAFTLKTLLSCGFSQSLYISLMKKGGAILLLALLPVSMIYADHETSPKDTVKLAYSPQQIDGADLMKVKDANFVNSLIGRVAGAAINPSASGVGGSVRMVLRGYRSILKSNNVLFTLDGVPLPRLEPEQSFNVNTSNWQTGDGIAAFSPDDIKSISVLSTAAASTLYGSRSASGVVMINTKKAHSGKLRVELGNSTTFSSPLVMPEFQQTYVAGWGEKTNHPQSWNPADFFRTGHTINNSLSLSIGNEYNQTRVSAVTMNGTGIIPNNDVDRYNFSFRNTSSLLNHRLKLDFTLRYIHTAEQNMLSQGMYGNPLVPVYLVPDVLQERISVNPDYNYKNHFEVYDPTAVEIMKWLNDTTIISGSNDEKIWNTVTIQLDDIKMKQRIVEFSRYADLGIENIEKIDNAIVSTHTQYDEEGHEVKTITFPFRKNESEGTIKYFSLAYPIIDALDNGKRLIIDEFDSKMHPLLTCRIIALFNSKETNPQNAQLIFTTHDTNLLSANIFRRDQVWFTQKDRYGATELYSLAEYKVRNDASFEKDYLSGKYGAIPIVGDLTRLFNTQEN